MKKKKIHLAAGPDDYNQYFMPLAGDTIPGNMKYALGEINLSLRPVPADSLYFTTVQSASAGQQSAAASFAANILYQVNLQDTLVKLNPYFMFPQNDGMRYQKLDVIVGIPVNTEVEIDEPLRWKANYFDFRDGSREGGPYIMTSSGLQLKNPPAPEPPDTIQDDISERGRKVTIIRKTANGKTVTERTIETK